MKEVILPQSSPIIQCGTFPTQSHVNLIEGIHSLRESSPGEYGGGGGEGRGRAFSQARVSPRTNLRNLLKLSKVLQS